MSEIRLRLYQYTHSPYCIPVQLILRDGNIPHECVNLRYGDPSPVIELTQGRCYQVPVLHDLHTQEIIWDRHQESHEVALYLNALSPALNLFPAEKRGVHDVLVHYIENHCEDAGFKVCDAGYERWAKDDLERGLLRRHKERKFGVGCLDRWQEDLTILIRTFIDRVAPFEHMLSQHPYLLGETPVFADYALAGVVRNFLFSGAAQLPQEWSAMAAWLERLKDGRLVLSLDENQAAAQDQFGRQSSRYGHGHILENVEDVVEALADINLRPGSKVLDVATGAGHAGLYLAGRGMDVTLSDIAAPMLEEAAKLAEEKGLKVQFQQHTAEKLPYPDQTFDLVICRVAAHHFSSPSDFVAEAARVLKMYGRLVIIDGTVSDDQPEAAAWMHDVEKLRDPSHGRFISPRQWQAWCQRSELRVQKCKVGQQKMPDLKWYFATAATPPESQRQILEMIGRIPRAARDLFQLTQSGASISWMWQRVTIVAGKI